jgi:predicted HTH domain antitoxin
VYISGYRSGDLSGFQAARILGYDSRFEFEEFLKLRGIYEHAYTASDLAEDLNSLNNLKLPPDANNSR